LENGHEKGHSDGHERRGREDYEGLDRLLDEARQSIEGEDLRGANETLKRAAVKAASMWGEVGRPRLPEHTRRLVGLIGEVQQDLDSPGQSPPNGFPEEISELRSRFECEARRDAGQPTL
jgi:hypothetical protein